MPNKNHNFTKNHLLRQLLQRRINALENDKENLSSQLNTLEVQVSDSIERNSSAVGKIQYLINQTLQSVQALNHQVQSETDFTMRMALNQRAKLLNQIKPLQQQYEQLHQKLTDAIEGIHALHEQVQNNNGLLVEDAILRQERLTQELQKLYDSEGYLRIGVDASKEAIATIQQQVDLEIDRIEGEAKQLRERVVVQIERLSSQTNQVDEAMQQVMNQLIQINRLAEIDSQRAVDAFAAAEAKSANVNDGHRIKQARTTSSSEALKTSSQNEARFSETAAHRLADLSEKAYQTAAHELKSFLPRVPVEGRGNTTRSQSLHDTAAMRLKAIDPHVVVEEEIDTSETGKKIAKNAGVLMASQLSTWVLTLVLMLFLPRYLGAEAVGQLHLAGSMWAILAIMISFGMDRLLIKEIARYPEKTSQLFSTSVFLRTILYFIGLGIMSLYLNVLDYPLITIQVVYVIGLSQLMWQLVETCQAALQGLEQMQYMSLANIVGKAVNTVVSIALLLLGFNVLAVAAVSILSAFINLVIQLVYLNRLQPIRLHFSLSDALAMMKGGSPYLLTRLSLVIYQQVDIIIISFMVNEITVGWYGVADQLFGTFLFIPTVFMTAVFPALSRMYATASDELSKVMSKSFDILLLLSVPIGLGLLVIADPLVVLLFGKAFAPSGPVLAVLGIVLILTYQNILLGQFLVSTDRQNYWTIVMTVGAIATIPLDLILIPWCAQEFGNGAIGGAMVFVITELCMTVAGLGLLPEGSLGWRNLWLALRVVLAGVIMMIATWWVRDFIGVSVLESEISELVLSLVLQVLTGAVTYIVAGLLLQIVSKEDRAVLAGFASSIVRKIRPQSVAT